MEKYVECHNCKNQYDCERTYLGGCTDGKEWQQEEKKLTDEEIVKALECCSKNNTDCDNCPCSVGYGSLCRQPEQQALDLIHRLQSKVAKYEQEFADGKLVSKEWHDEQVLHAEAEIERLTEERDMYADDLYWKAEVRKREDFITELTVENAELQKQVDELKAEKEDLYFQNQNLQTYIDNHEPIWKRNAEQSVKDTAKEILQEAENLLHECAMEYANAGHKDYFGVCENISWKVIRKIAKEKGVEVE